MFAVGLVQELAERWFSKSDSNLAVLGFNMSNPKTEHITGESRWGGARRGGEAGRGQA